MEKICIPCEVGLKSVKYYLEKVQATKDWNFVYPKGNTQILNYA
jgi:hypothetical protein